MIGQEVLCALEAVKINILGGVCSKPKGSVFLEGIKVTSLVVCVSNLGLVT